MRRGQPLPTDSRLAQGDFLAGTRSDKLYDTVDVLDEIAAETGKTVSQVALRWVLQRPSVVSIVVGARNEEQLKQNLGAVGWALDVAQMGKLDAASAVQPIYPYWHQRNFAALSPSPVK
jgi:aryl-alcohol dehydrogenase-like predicted oxidoreductase